MKKLYSKNNLTTIFNIIGMSIAFAVFMIIMTQVRWDWGYDKNYKNSDRIVRFEHNFMEEGYYYGMFCRPIIEAMKGVSPNIEAIGTFSSNGESEFFPIEHPENKVNVNLASVDSAYLRVFPFEFISGGCDNFADNRTIIAESVAKTIFGDDNPVGKMIKNASGTEAEIIGVYKDFPKNSSVVNGLISSLGDDCINDQSEWSFVPYALVKDISQLDQTTKAIADKLTSLLDQDDPTDVFKHFRLNQIHNVYFSRDLHSSDIKGNKSITNTLFCIAILLIIIAIINFINFAFARIPFNIKEINTRKVLGASKKSLIFDQLLRAVILAIVAFLLALLIVHVVAGSKLASMIQTSIKPSDNIFLVLLTLVIAIVSAIIAGIGPAVYSTSQPMSLVLKGSYAMSAKGKGLRNMLVSIQFILSFIFIIFALYINLQTKYMQKKNMGFNEEQILEAKVGSASKNVEAFKDKLMQNSAIEDVTFADSRIVSKNRMNWGRSYEGESVFADVLPVSTNFISFFDMEIIEGRDFLESDNKNPNGTMIVNQSFINAYPKLRVGNYFHGHSETGPSEIVGEVKDFNFKPLQYAIEPIILYNWGTEPWRNFLYAYLKMAPNTNPKDVIDYIKKTVCEFDPTTTEESVNVDFLDDRIQAYYDKERALGRLITISSIVALIIAIIGIIGLVFFETQFIRKEIAVRKVNGATVSDILQMINKKYIIMGLISFAVSVPIVYYLISSWRKSFAYQATIPIWIFIVALLVVILATVIVVTLQSWRAASANPIESLRND